MVEYLIKYMEEVQHMKKSKVIAPIVVAIIMIIYFMSYFAFMMYVMEPNVWIIALGAIIPLGLSITMICVAIQRIKEIGKGEEDDLSKY